MSKTLAFRPGQRCGYLTVIERTEQRKCGAVLWRCLCDCGHEALVRSDRLKHGRNQSCGCEWHTALIARNYRHGGNQERLYRIWEKLRARCNSPASKDFRNFGAHGVTLCEEWRDYTVFRAWAMAHGYANDFSIQLIDRASNYEPANCRWAKSHNYPKQRRAEKTRMTAHLETDINASP